MTTDEALHRMSTTLDAVAADLVRGLPGGRDAAMSAHDHEQPCDGSVTIERVGDTVILTVPFEGQHIEMTFARNLAIRIGSALVRTAVDEARDNLSDAELAKLIPAIRLIEDDLT